MDIYSKAKFCDVFFHSWDVLLFCTCQLLDIVMSTIAYFQYNLIFFKKSKMILLKICKIFFENETSFLHNCNQNTDSHLQSRDPVRPMHLFCVQSIWIHQDQMSKAGYISIGCP